jgi:hypothetical protein
MKAVILNQTNAVNNYTYTYRFPNPVEFKNNQLAVASVSMYYSWPNICSATTNGRYNNDQFSYTWIDGAVVSVDLPDGFYDVSALNAFLQSTMVANNHYMIDASGNYVYYLELQTNASRYAVQFNAYPVPTSLPTGWTKPGAWAYPNPTKTPTITILSTNNFGTVIGFNAGTYPSSVQNTTYSKVSDFVPQITPVSAVLITCSLVDNRYSIPNNIVYSFSPNVTYGSQIQLQQQGEFTWVDVQDGQQQSLTVTFLDQNKNPLPLLDTNIVILLSIRGE